MSKKAPEISKSTTEIKRLNFFREESNKSLLYPFRMLAQFTAVAGLVALFFEIRFFPEYQLWIAEARTSAIFVALVLLSVSYTKLGKKHPVFLVHILLFTIICSFGAMIYLIPKTLIFNSQIISLLIFVAALFLSWDVTNQIIVAIYYNFVFAASILMSSKTIFILPNMIESVILVCIISVMAVVASYINYKLRHEAVVKNFDVSLSEKKFRTLVENSAEGIFQFNADGKFLTVNPALQKILGYNGEEELKKLYLSKDVFKRLSDWELLCKLLEKQGRVRNYRVPFTKKDGNEITVRMNVRMNDEDETATQIFEGSLQDISQQILAENEKQKALDALRMEKLKADTAAKQAQQESNFKTKFLASMSHEVRTPMNSVMGFLTLIENDLYEDREELKSFAHDARQAAESPLDIINNILDISKVEAGKMELDEVEFNLNTEISKVISIIYQSAKAKGVALEKFIDPAIPDKIIGDPTRLRQIVLNLLGNALKFTDAGKIGIDIRVKSRDEFFIELITSITDTGAGIASDKLNLLFEPFSQIKGKKSSKEGTGLGLMIVKEFVKLMQGEITVESTLGAGSRFSFTAKLKLQIDVPIEKSEPVSKVEVKEVIDGTLEIKETKQPVVQTKKRLLLVEDNPISQNLETKILREVGYDVEPVSSGTEAIEAVKSGTYNLVLMDVEMTDMDGITATKKIRELSGTFSKIPIIAVTAHSSMKDRERCLSSGMDDYIAKPINIHFLKITIDQWLNNERD